jgi:hypothetical protein
VYLNGHWTGPLDVYTPVIDLCPWLVNGINELRIEVSSTLRNRLIAFNSSQSWEQGDYAAKYGPQPYGLVKPVLLTAYESVKISIGG